MLNRVTGWLLFTQVTYIAAFVAVSLVDLAGRASGSFSLRASFGIFRLADYLFHPIVFTAPFNVLLMLLFSWGLLRRGISISLSEHFFCMLNGVYVVTSGWVLFFHYTQAIR